MNLIEAFGELNNSDDRLFAPAISKYKNKLITNRRNCEFTDSENSRFGVHSIVNQKILTLILKNPKFGIIAFGLLTLGLINSLYDFVDQIDDIGCTQIIDLIKLINGSYSLILIYIFLVRDDYINRLTIIWKTLGFSKYKLCYVYFYLNRKKYHLAIYIVYGFILIEDCYNLYKSRNMFFGKSYELFGDGQLIISLLIYGVHFCCTLLVDLIILSQDLILIDTCYLAYSTLHLIKANLGQFNQESINRSTLSYYRKKYTIACDFIISANGYSKFYIFAMYTSNMIILITRVYFTFFVPNTIKHVLTVSAFHLNHLIGVSIITYLVTKTHSLTRQVQDELYPITFKTQQIPSLYEVSLYNESYYII